MKVIFVQGALQPNENIRGLTKNVQKHFTDTFGIFDNMAKCLCVQIIQ